MTATPRTAAGQRVALIYPHLADAMTEVEREAEAREGLDMRRLALRDALTPLHPLPWVVYEQRGANWIKDAENQWVGFTYSLPTAHLVVQIVNAIAAAYGGQPRSDALREALKRLLDATGFPVYEMDGQPGSGRVRKDDLHPLIEAAEQARAALRESEEER